jgi:Tfp pilus assembly protein PilZ
LTRLKLHLLERSDFTRYLDPSVDGVGLFVPGSETPAVGAPVTLEVVFRGGPRVLLHGRICWRRATGDARTRPGVGVTLEAAEQPKMTYLLGYVRGGLIDVREKRRLPVRLRVAYSSTRGRRINFTRDLNEEGAFVRAAELLDVGQKTVLLLSPPGDFKPFEVHATVTRQAAEGTDRGIGVRFDFPTVEERERFGAFVARLEQDYLDGKLPDDALL